MRTEFTAAQRADPAIAESEAILRKCVHCGFCTATCPTYVLLGDELDSPRGRIWLIKDMLENDRAATADIVPHIDRCLSCLSCMTTCPSGVDYRRLIDRARTHVESTYRRPFADRWLRRALAWLMPYPRRFAALLPAARLLRPVGRWLPVRLAAMLALVPARQRSEAQSPAGAIRPAAGVAAGRVAVLTGCVQSVIGASINNATLRVLVRAGFDVVPVAGCCGSIVQHLGREAQSRALAGDLVRRLVAASTGGAFDAIVSNASGCGTQLKDLAYVLRDDAELGEAAAAFAAVARDVSEVLLSCVLPEPDPVTGPPPGMRVAYHPACSLQHGQRVHEPPRQLLRAAGFDVVEIPEAHLCCGSAGTYNMLQPDIAARLAARKLDNIAAVGAQVVAAGNLGCLTQLTTQAGPGSGSSGAERPAFVHTVELLDWATGGTRPPAMR